MPLKKYRVFWLFGIEEDIEGLDIADAFNRAGYGAGALQSVDYYKELEEDL